MIKINLLKKERKRLTLPDLSKLREIHPREFLKERALVIVPIVSAVVIVGELFYAYRLKGEIEQLQAEISRLTAERNSLKRKADIIQAKKKALQQEINRIRGRIRYLEVSKEVILALKGYYQHKALLPHSQAGVSRAAAGRDKERGEQERYHILRLFR